MKLPKQAVPVSKTTRGWIDYKKNEQPNSVVDFFHANSSSRFNLSIDLLGGANYNAPMRFLTPVGSHGCHILSGNSMAMCLAAYRLR